MQIFLRLSVASREAFARLLSCRMIKVTAIQKQLLLLLFQKRCQSRQFPHTSFSDDSLSYVSMILCEQLRTIDKKRLGQWICTLDEKTLEKINRAIRVSLSI